MNSFSRKLSLINTEYWIDTYVINEITRDKEEKRHRKALTWLLKQTRQEQADRLEFKFVIPVR